MINYNDSSIILIIIDHKHTYFNNMSLMESYKKYAREFVHYITYNNFYLTTNEYINIKDCFNTFIEYITLNQIYNGSQLTYMDIFEIMDSIYQYTDFRIDDFDDEDDYITTLY